MGNMAFESIHSSDSVKARARYDKAKRQNDLLNTGYSVDRAIDRSSISQVRQMPFVVMCPTM